jgi:hypothetical protein
MNKWVSISVLTVALAVSSVAFAQQLPVDNVGRRHPNLEAAQHLCTKAFEKLVASQKANEFDEGGHAEKAKELLDQVNAEIAKAAEFDNSRKK